MASLQEIFTQYARLRNTGLEVKAVLYALRDDIEALSDKERKDLGRFLRALEAGEIQPPRPIQEAPRAAPPPRPEIDQSDPIRKLKITSEARASTPAALAPDVVWLNCPNCGKSNQKHELVCYACGQLLEPPHSTNETRALAETNDLTPGNDFFSANTVLVLRVRDSGRVFEVQPQHSDHEMVIGRSTSGSAMIPDIDLAPDGGEKLGVSRLHLTIRYDGKSHTVSLVDLGSANGSYINGQRLHPHEVRVLHDHDEVRLGKMVLTAAFRHN